MAQRLSPRPSFYSAASGQKLEISYEFESYLLALSDADKSAMISRVRKAMQTTNKSAIRDDLAKQALDIEAGNDGACQQELSVQLGDFESFQEGQMDVEINELQMLVTDVSQGFALPMFRFQEAKYGVVYNALLRDGVTGESNTTETKRELSSWIDVVHAYM